MPLRLLNISLSQAWVSFLSTKTFFLCFSSSCGAQRLNQISRARLCEVILHHFLHSLYLLSSFRLHYASYPSHRKVSIAFSSLFNQIVWAILKIILLHRCGTPCKSRRKIHTQKYFALVMIVTADIVEVAHLMFLRGKSYVNYTEKLFLVKVSCQQWWFNVLHSYAKLATVPPHSRLLLLKPTPPLFVAPNNQFRSKLSTTLSSTQH